MSTAEPSLEGLQETFREWFGDTTGVYELTILEADLLAALVDCDEQLPIDWCLSIGSEPGPTYGEAAEQLLADHRPFLEGASDEEVERWEGYARWAADSAARVVDDLHNGRATRKSVRLDVQVARGMLASLATRS